MLPLSSYARLLIVDGSAAADDPAERPVRRAGRARPGGAAVGRHLDTATAGRRPISAAVPVMVTGAPAANEAPLAGAVIVEVGGGDVGRRRRGDQPRLQRAGLRAHVGEQVDRRLLHPHVGGERAAVVRRVEAPRPLHGAGAEDQRAARMAVERELVGDGARPEGRSVVEQHAVDAARRRRQLDQAGRAEAVVDVRIPFVAERARAASSRWRRPPASRPSCCARSASCRWPPGR